MAISVNVTETVVNTDVTNTDITVALTEQTTNVELTYPGPQGASAIVNVTTPITNTGTTTEPNIGIDQTLLSLARTQIVGTAVTEAAGKALTAGTADYATLAGTSSFSTNAGTATYATNAGSATTAGTADYATLAGTAVNISGTIAPTQVTGTAAILGANTFTDQQTITPTNAVGLFVKGGAASNDIFQAQINGAATNRFIINTAGRTAIGSPATIFNSAFLSVSSVFTTNPAIVVRAVASQTADLQQWQDSAGTALTSITSAGYLNFGSGNLFRIQYSGNTVMEWQPAQGSRFFSYGASNIPMSVRGAASQTGDLTQWLDSGNTVRAQVSSAGAFTLTPSSGIAMTLTTASSSTVGFRINGSASQSARLLEVYDSTPTRIASIDQSGNIRGNQIRTNNDLGLMGELSTGSYLTLYTMSANTPAVPGAGYGRLYLKTGTNANTLKLCIRAGAAGAETTILDNIPT